MTIAQSTSRIALAPYEAGAPFAVDTDLFVIPCFEKETPGIPGLDEAAAGEPARALASGEFNGKLYELFVTPIVGDHWKARRVALVGAGKRADYTMDRLRKLATAVALSARQRRVTRIAVLHPSGTAIAPADAVQATAEGLLLADFDSTVYKTSDENKPPLQSAEIVIGGSGLGDRLMAALERGRVLGECSNHARALANEPANALTPRVFADKAAAIASETGVAVEILDERGIGELGMGLLLGVARGSDEPPRLIVLRHDPPGATGPVLGLVGKGITFDTGGISIKPADGMERMKDDMAGGAAVVCAMRALAALGAPVRVVGVVPATENMPSGHAIKPGDVLRGANGKTVEVINTDAEGRLILGDGLWYARELGATHLVDVATLTGACVVALGKITSGLFGMPAEWVERVRRAADRAGDRSWPMPLYEEYFEQLKSDIADMTNSGGRPAGAITASMFLKEFAGGLPWVHMDIAGTAWADEPKPFMPKGATGVAVRTLAELALANDSWPGAED
jgi:leucyl aminopeptidase